MALAWTIGRFFNIPIRLHYSMLLLLFTYGWIGGEGADHLIRWAILIVLIFGSILLHEIGHALTARRFGIRTHDIVLTPIGGIARLAGMPKDPRQEILVAVAGPAVSFLIAGVSFVGVSLSIFVASGPLWELFVSLLQVNMMLGLFNLIPALPMDGGRILRGVLSLKYDHLTATRKAANVARTLAVLGGSFAILGSMAGLFAFQFTHLIIAGFVYFTAGMELRMAQFRAYQEQASAKSEWDLGRGGGAGQSSGSKSWNFTASPFGRGEGTNPEGNPVSTPGDPDPSAGWHEKPPSRGSAVVIEGGKAEILSRNDPKLKE